LLKKIELVQVHQVVHTVYNNTTILPGTVEQQYQYRDPLALDLAPAPAVSVPVQQQQLQEQMVLREWYLQGVKEFEGLVQRVRLKATKRCHVCRSLAPDKRARNNLTKVKRKKLDLCFIIINVYLFNHKHLPVIQNLCKFLKKNMYMFFHPF
jgi:hypothetical protein